MMGKGGAITHPASMIRRDAIVALSGYREDLAPAEDYDLFLRLAEQGRLANLPDMLLQYRQHLTSFGYTQRKRQQQAAQIALKEAHNRRGLEMRCNVEGPVVGDRREPDHHLKWAWWALQAGNVATARKHAFTALRKSPLSGRSWKTMLCAVRGFCSLAMA